MSLGRRECVLSRRSCRHLIGPAHGTRSVTFASGTLLWSVSGLDISCCSNFFFFQAEDGIRDWSVTGVQTCALPIFLGYQVIFGQAGALSLAQGAFFGLGAYATAILCTRLGWGSLLTFPVSVALPMA